MTTLAKSQWNNNQKEENYKKGNEHSNLLHVKKEGGKLQHCISAKEMWETLKNHYEGNVREIQEGETSCL